MNLILERMFWAPNCTIGYLYIDNKFECYTLEEPLENAKNPRRVCIPSGKYKLKLTYSPKFKKIMPLVINVPKRRGIRIHVGNSPKDTHGCILVGQEWNSDRFDWISRSRLAYKALMKKLQGKSDISLTILA